MKWFAFSSCVVFICCLTGGSAQSPRLSWPMIGGDPGRTSRAQMDLQFPLHIMKSISVGHDLANGIAVDGEFLCVGSHDGARNQIYSYDLILDEPTWSFSIPHTGGGMEFNPAVSESVVLAGGQGGNGIYALDRQTGDSLWFQPVGSLYTRSPIIVDSMVYIIGNFGLYCLDLYSGAEIWSHQIDYLPQISPAADQSFVYYGRDDSLFAASLHTGEILWRKGILPVNDFCSISVDDAHVYLTQDTTIAAVNKVTGQVKWSRRTPPGYVVNFYPSAIALHDSVMVIKLYGGPNLDNQYLVLNKDNGTPIHTFTAFKNFGAPTIIDQFVVEYQDGTLRFLDIMTGQIAYELNDLPVLGHYNQIIGADGKIYISGQGPDLVVVQGSTSRLISNSTSGSWEIRPNPSNGDFYIHFEQYEPMTPEFIACYRPDGTMVFQMKVTGQHQKSMHIDRDLAPGIYIVRCVLDRGHTSKQLVITSQQ